MIIIMKILIMNRVLIESGRNSTELKFQLKELTMVQRGSRFAELH